MENVILESEKFFDALIAEGTKKKYPHITEEIITRIEREKAVIKKLGYCSYYLLALEVWQAVKEADEYVSSEGTQSGSIINYLLGITATDPIENELFFESFINEGYDKLPYPRFFFNIRTFAKERICVSIEKRMREIGIEVRFDEDKLADSYTVFFIDEKIDENFHIFLAKDQYADFIRQCDKLANKRLVPEKDYADEKVWTLFENDRFVNPLIDFPKQHRRYHPQNYDQLVNAVTGGFFLTDFFCVHQLLCLDERKRNKTQFCFREEIIYLYGSVEGIGLAKAHDYYKRFHTPTLKDKALEEFIADGKKAGYDETLMRKIVNIDSPFRYAWKAIAFSYAEQLYKIAYYQAHFPDLFSLAVKKYYQDRLIDLCHAGFVILDLETDGLEPVKNDGEDAACSILKIDALRIERGTIVDRYQSFVYREKDLPSELSELLKINNEVLHSAPKIDEVLKNLSAFIGKMPVIVHNVPFVEKFINFYDSNRLFKRFYCENVITYFNKIVQPDKQIRTMRGMRKTLHIKQTITDAEAMREMVCMLIDL